MARSVVPLRLSDAEKAQIERAARKQPITLSEFLGRAALTLSFRLTVEGAAEPEQEPRQFRPTAPAPQRAEDDGPFVVNSYGSLGQYAASSPY